MASLSSIQQGETEPEDYGFQNIAQSIASCAEDAMDDPKNCNGNFQSVHVCISALGPKFMDSDGSHLEHPQFSCQFKFCNGSDTAEGVLKVPSPSLQVVV